MIRRLGLVQESTNPTLSGVVDARLLLLMIAVSGGSGLALDLAHGDDVILCALLPLLTVLAAMQLPLRPALVAMICGLSFQVASAILDPNDRLAMLLSMPIQVGAVFLGRGLQQAPRFADGGHGATGNEPGVRSRGELDLTGFRAQLQGTSTSQGPLSRRQREVLDLATSGLTARQIGARLFISERTVESHVAKIYEMLGVHSRAELLERLGQTTTTDVA